MNNILKAFAGTKVEMDVKTLLETGKATFDMVDLTWALSAKLYEMLEKEGLKVTEKPNFFSRYCRDFQLV